MVEEENNTHAHTHTHPHTSIHKTGQEERGYSAGASSVPASRHRLIATAQGHPLRVHAWRYAARVAVHAHTCRTIQFHSTHTHTHTWLTCSIAFARSVASCVSCSFENLTSATASRCVASCVSASIPWTTCDVRDTHTHTHTHRDTHAH